MKKVIAVILVVALAIGAFSFVMPASAEPDIKFKASIVPGAYPQTAHTLEKGEVKVYNNGTFEIKVWGCKPEQKYVVNLGSYQPTLQGGTLKWVSGGVTTFTTDEKGAAKVSGIIPDKFSQWSIFVINEFEAAFPNRFVSGFQTP